MSKAIKEARLLMEMPTLAPANEHRRIIENLLAELSQYQKVVDAAKRMMNFDLPQYVLHKEAGDHEHRDPDTLDLLESLSKIEGANNE